ncbi:hypothetical protein L204_103319 [Cryptococcus depauperatus]|nr:hypothetical protein L204_01636 [Cryptococcus depauperatus CBS 7855]
MLRVKLSLLPPFEPKKILLPIPREAKYISDLKKFIVENLSVVAQHASSLTEITLEIDGFEVLGGSSLKVIEPTDVVCVRISPGNSKVTTGKRLKRERKREAANVEHENSPKKRKKSVIAPALKHSTSSTPKPQPKKTVSLTPPQERSLPSRSSSSSGSGSSSSSSSSQTSSSSSSTDTSSSGECDSSDNDGQSSAKILPQNIRPGKILQPLKLVQSTVPPGHGKLETQNRNARRRIARQMKKLQYQSQTEISTAYPPAKDESLGSVPNGTTTFTTPQLPLPRDMSNRNKKKGFLKEMAGVKGTKIVFEKNVQTQSRPADEILQGTDHRDALRQDWSLQDLPYREIDRSSNGISTSTPRRHWITPSSEMMSLPNNIFVTRAEFGDAWYGHKNKSGYDDCDEVYGEEAVDIEEEDVWKEQEAPFEEEQGATGEGNDLWEQAEDRFDFLKCVTADDMARLEHGAFLAYKELELDLVTFSPELKVKLAKVLSVSEGKVTAEKLQRPVYGEDGQLLELDKEDDEPARIDLDTNEIQSGRWRVLS